MARYTDRYVHEFTTEGEGRLGAAMQKQGSALQSGAQKWSNFAAVATAIGPRIEAAGDAVLGFARKNVALYAEAERIDQVLASMFARRGMEGQVEDAKRFATELQSMAGINDEITKSSMGMMASYGMTFEQMKELMPYLGAQADVFAAKGLTVVSVADQIGKALGSGMYGRLAQTGITMSGETKAILEQAQAMQKSSDAATSAAGKQMAYNALLKTMHDFTPDVTDRLKTLQGQQERFNATLGDAREKMGEGVADVQRLGYAYGTELLANLVKADAGLLRTAGNVSAVAGAGLKGAGKGLSIIRDVGEFLYLQKMSNAVTGATKGKNLLTKATQGDILAERTKTGVAGQEAMALRGVTKDVKAATAAKIALGKAGYVGGAGLVGRQSMMAGMRGELGRGAAGVPLVGSALAAPVGAAPGALGALTTVTLIAGTAYLGWEVGSAIAKWLDKETGYQEKGGEQVADWFRKGTIKSAEAEAGKAATGGEIEQMRVGRQMREEGYTERQIERSTTRRDRTYEEFRAQLPGTRQELMARRTGLPAPALEPIGVRPQQAFVAPARQPRGPVTRWAEAAPQAAPGGRPPRRALIEPAVATRRQKVVAEQQRTAQQPGGDLTADVNVKVTIPRQQVLTQQAMQDHARAR